MLVMMMSYLEPWGIRNSELQIKIVLTNDSWRSYHVMFFAEHDWTRILCQDVAYLYIVFYKSVNVWISLNVNM